jgi:hypothetical protein
MAIIMPFLYRLLGKKRLYKLIAKGECDVPSLHENPLGFAAWLVQEHACMIGRVVTEINFC